MKNREDSCDLNSCMFCKLCLPEWLPVVDANRKMVTINKGALIFEEGELMTGVHFIYKGLVKVHKQWGQKELIVRFAHQGDIVGHRGLGGDNIYPVSGTALQKTKACFIPLDIFTASLKVNYDFMHQLMLFFAEELKLSERKMRNLAHMNVKERIAQALLSLKNKFGVAEEGYINILLSKQDLASYTATTYETVFRVMTDLVDQGMVDFDGKKIFIRDEAAIQLLIVDN